MWVWFICKGRCGKNKGLSKCFFMLGSLSGREGSSMCGCGLKYDLWVWHMERVIKFSVWEESSECGCGLGGRRS